MNLNKHFTILLVSCIALLSMGVSCKDKNKPTQKSYCEQFPGMCETVVESKDYFCFKQGTWWVYEEENTHQRDSLYVTSNANDSEGYNFDTYIFSLREQKTFHYFPSYFGNNGCSLTGTSANKCIYINRSKFSSNDFFGEDICFFIQYKLGDQLTRPSVSYPQNKLTVLAYHNEFNLNGMTLPKTIVMHEDHTMNENYSQTNHYFTKGIGLTRKELIDSNQVWNLVNYNIEQ